MENMIGNIFEELDTICERPAPFEFYTASNLWTDEHTARQMLKFHLDESVDISSLRVATTFMVFTAAGFSLRKSIESAFSMRFLNESSFLNHSVIVSGFSGAWRNLFEEDEIGPFFERLENNLNLYAEKHGELKLNIPMLYLECGKEN